MSQHAQQLVTSIEGYLNTLRDALPTLSVDVQALRSACNAGHLDDADARMEAAEKVMPSMRALHMCVHGLDVSMAQLNASLSEDVVKCFKARTELLMAQASLDEADVPATEVVISGHQT
jgi:hypothetical protein